jgi:hypothetical protein
LACWSLPKASNLLSVDFNREIHRDHDRGRRGNGQRKPALATLSGKQENKPAAAAMRDEADEGGRVQNKVRKPSGIEKFFNFLRGGNRDKKEKPKAPPAVPGGHR